jgi:putative hydrolase of the HAD superfamily
VSCVVFDIDDTLYLEREYVRSGFEVVGDWFAKTFRIEGFSALAWAAFEKGLRGSTFNLVAERLGIAPTPALIHEMVRIYRQHKPDISLCADAQECVTGLKGVFRLAAITDGPIESQQAKVHSLGLSRWLDPIIYTAELGTGYGKPHPRAFEIVEEFTGCQGEACVYIADNPSKDFGGPDRLKWRSVRIRRPGSLHFDLQSPEDALEIASMDEVLTYLARQSQARKKQVTNEAL